jgi:hypothetical protein
MGRFCNRGVSQNSQPAPAAAVLLKEESMPNTYDRSHARMAIQGLMPKPALGEAALFKRAQSFSWGENMERLDLASTDSVKTVGTQVERSVQHVPGLVFPNGPTSRNIVVSRTVETQQLESQSYLIDSVSKKDGHLPISIGSQDRVILDLDAIRRDLSVDLSKERNSGGKLVLITGGDGVETKAVFDAASGTARIQVGARSVSIKGLSSGEDLLLSRSKGHLSRGEVMDIEAGANQTKAREVSKPKEERSPASNTDTAKPPQLSRDEQAVKDLESELECQRESMKHAEAELAKKDALIKEQATKLDSLEAKVVQLTKAVEALAKAKEAAEPAKEPKPSSSAPAQPEKPAQSKTTEPPKQEPPPQAKMENATAPKPMVPDRAKAVAALREQGFVSEDPNYPGFLYKPVEVSGKPSTFLYQHAESGERFSMQKGNGSAYRICRQKAKDGDFSDVVQIRDKLGTGDIIMSKGEFDSKGVWHPYDMQYMTAVKGFTKVDATPAVPMHFYVTLRDTMDHKYYPKSGTFVLETHDQKREKIVQVHASTPNAKQREELWNASYFRQPAYFDFTREKYRSNFLLWESGMHADEQ